MGVQWDKPYTNWCIHSMLYDVVSVVSIGMYHNQGSIDVTFSVALVWKHIPKQQTIEFTLVIGSPWGHFNVAEFSKE